MARILGDDTVTVGDAIREILDGMVHGLYRIPANASSRERERLRFAHVAMVNFALELENVFTARDGVRVEEVRLPK